MGAREQWCAVKIANLEDQDLRLTTLNEIKEYFSELSQNEAAETANLLQLPLVFDCLNDSNTQQVDLACEVLTLCMGNLNLGESTNRYGVLLERALKHPYPVVKITALKEIQRNCNSEELLTDLTRRTSLLNSVIKCIGNEDLEVAKIACNIITQVGLSKTGIKQLLTDDVTKEIHNVLSVSEIVRLRVFEVFISIAKESESLQISLESAGFLQLILQDLNNNDVLLRLNVIELLSQFVVTKHGYEYLESQGVMNRFLKQFMNESDPLNIQICEPGILKFFGKLAHWRPDEILSKYSYFITRIFANIESDDQTLIGVSLDTLGYIALTNEGKTALDSLPDGNILKMISAITEKLNYFTTELRLRALSCLENLLQVSSVDNQVMNVTRKWFSAMGSDPMEWVLKYAKNPFSEIRSAGLTILNTLSMQHWGQEIIKNTPGLIEFLLDRNIETIKECKEIKFDIVKNLSQSSVLGHGEQVRLEAFIKEGPFYVQGVTEVAIEGND